MVCALEVDNTCEGVFMELAKVNNLKAVIDVDLRAREFQNHKRWGDNEGDIDIHSFMTRSTAVGSLL